jgi:hypothetical protein
LLFQRLKVPICAEQPVVRVELHGVEAEINRIAPRKESSIGFRHRSDSFFAEVEYSNRTEKRTIKAQSMPLRRPPISYAWRHGLRMQSRSVCPAFMKLRMTVT